MKEPAKLRQIIPDSKRVEEKMVSVYGKRNSQKLFMEKQSEKKGKKRYKI